MTQLIKFENVSFYYDQICALEKINLTICAGDFLGILGPNGGGKTTLLKLILGLLKPSDGRITYYGNSSMDGFSAQNRPTFGYVPQFSKFDKNFPINVSEVVSMGRLKGRLRLFQRLRAKDRDKTRKILEQLEISDLANRQIGQLSGGQLQRVLIARALAMEPNVLLLDEPTASLDTHYKTELYTLLKNLNHYLTIILITHDIGLVSAGITKVACVNQKLFYHGTEWMDQNLMQQVYGYPVHLVDHHSKEKDIVHV